MAGVKINGELSSNKLSDFFKRLQFIECPVLINQLFAL